MRKWKGVSASLNDSQVLRLDLPYTDNLRQCTPGSSCNSLLSPSIGGHGFLTSQQASSMEALDVAETKRYYASTIHMLLDM